MEMTKGLERLEGLERLDFLNFRKATRNSCESLYQLKAIVFTLDKVYFSFNSVGVSYL